MNYFFLHFAPFAFGSQGGTPCTLLRKVSPQGGWGLDHQEGGSPPLPPLVPVYAFEPDKNGFKPLSLDPQA